LSSRDFGEFSEAATIWRSAGTRTSIMHRSQRLEPTLSKLARLDSFAVNSRPRRQFAGDMLDAFGTYRWNCPHRC
jgi:hypothetical protein